MKTSDKHTPAPQFLSRQQAAAEIGMTTQFIDRLLARGVLSRYNFGRAIRLARGEFDAWVEARRERTQ
jgi:excisionase family DNA binding protein